jgi:ComF family protein
VAGRVRESLRHLGSALAELALPRICVICKEPATSSAGLVCDGCWARLGALPSPQCQRCGHPTYGRDCRWCDLLPAYVRACRSVCWERAGSISQSAVHALKYGGWPAIAGELATRMGRLAWPNDVTRERTAIVPVPLGKARLRERGFNQSELLAVALAPHWNVPVWNDVLVRSRETTSQTRLTPEDRLRNVSGAFHASVPARIKLRGAHIVLIDDVVTTASTLNACAAALFDGGARVISFVTFARAPAAGDRS